MVVTEQALNSVVNFVVGLAIAKVYGLTLFGTFVFAITTSFLLGSLITSLTYTVATVDTARIHVSRASYISHMESLSLLIAILTAFFLVAVFIFIAPPHTIFEYFTFTYASFLGIFESVRRFGYLKPLAGYAVWVSTVRMLLTLPAMALGMSGQVDTMLILLLGQLVTGTVYAIVRIEWPRRLRPVYFFRAIRHGAPLVLSVVLTSGFEQLIVLLGARDLGISIVGGWRAASYLFGLLAPFLISLDALLPRVLRSRFGAAMRLPLPQLLLLGLTVSCICLVISGITVGLYLPYLGNGFQRYEATAYLYALVYAAISIKLVISVALRRESTRHLATANLLGAAFGLVTYLVHPVDPIVLLAFSICTSHLISLIAMGLIALRIGRNTAASTRI